MYNATIYEKGVAVPALQVRDFPEDTYQRLKTYAVSQHRSIAQQTIVAVTRMLDEANDAAHPDFTVMSNPKKSETAEERIARRRALFESFKQTKPSKSLPSPVAILKECRDELDARDAECIKLPLKRSDWCE